MSETATASVTPGAASTGAPAGNSAGAPAGSAAPGGTGPAAAPAGGSQNQSTPGQTQNPGTPPAATPAQVRKLGEQDMDAVVAITVNGKTVEKTVREAIKIQQLEQASYEKMKQAAQIEKQWKTDRALLDLARSNPEEFFKKVGKDADLETLAENVLAKKYEQMQMTPEQRELQQLRAERENQSKLERQSKTDLVKELKQYFPEATDDELFTYGKDQLAEALSVKRSEEARYGKELETEFLEAWKDSGLPKHKYFGALMSFTMLNHQKAHNSPLQAKEAAAKVKQDFLSSSREVATQMDAPAILDWLGDANVKKIREHLIEQVTGKPASPINPDQGPSREASQEKKYVNQFRYRQILGIK